MVAVVHEVFIVAPELLHVHAGRAAGEGQSELIILIGSFAAHILDASAAICADDLSLPGGDLLRRVAEVVNADHIQVQMQRRGTLDDRVVYIAAGTVFGAVAVVIGEAIQAKIEVWHIHLKVRDHSALIADDGDAVAGDGDPDSHAVLRRLVVAVLALIAGFTRVDGDGQRRRRSNIAVVGAGRRNRGRVSARAGVGKMQTAIGKLGVTAEVVAGQGIGHAVALAVRKQVCHFDYELCALFRGKRGVFRHSDRMPGCRFVRRKGHCRQHTQQHGKNQQQTCYSSFHTFLLWQLLSKRQLQLPPCPSAGQAGLRFHFGGSPLPRRFLRRCSFRNFCKNKPCFSLKT